MNHGRARSWSHSRQGDPCGRPGSHGTGFIASSDSSPCRTPMGAERRRFRKIPLCVEPAGKIKHIIGDDIEVWIGRIVDRMFRPRFQWPRDEGGSHALRASRL